MLGEYVVQGMESVFQSSGFQFDDNEHSKASSWNLYILQVCNMGIFDHMHINSFLTLHHILHETEYLELNSEFSH